MQSSAEEKAGRDMVQLTLSKNEASALMEALRGAMSPGGDGAGVLVPFDSGSRRAPPKAQTNHVVPAQQADRASRAWYRIPAHEIVYAFLGSKTTTELVDTKWAGHIAFDQTAVYVRTTKGVFRTRFSHLDDLNRALHGFTFVGVNRSLMARLDRIRLLDSPSEVGVDAGNVVEMLHAAHRDFNSILARSGLSRRNFK